MKTRVTSLQRGFKMTDKSLFVESLEHWAELFRDGTLSDTYADDIAHLLEDKAHDLRGDMEDAV